MPRSRTQKHLASRIDLSYHRRLHPMRLLRRVLIVICTLGAVAWIGVSAVRVRDGKIALIDRINNPGPVCRAHAAFANDCQACHTGDGTGKFRLAITDAACLKCHDGSLHDANQKIAADASGVSRATLTLAVADPQRPGGAHSAGCVDCHTEHRGEAALLGGSDANCTACHANLAPATANGHPVVQNVVTAFMPGDHPHFGRSLTVDGKWVDPTKIKFNHKYHLNLDTPLKTDPSNCVRCHTTQEPSMVIAGTIEPPFAIGARKVDIFVPPWSSARAYLLSSTNVGSKPELAASEAGFSYMQPVRYAEHCAGCHPIEIADGVAVPHVELSVLREQLSDPIPILRAALNAMSPEVRQKALTKEVEVKSSVRGRRAKTTRIISEDEWINDKLDDLHGRFGSDPAKLEKYIVLQTTNHCTLCHFMNDGAIPAAMGGSPATSDPTTQPILATLPTGIPDTPRHWFVNSRFDHRAHRDIRCVDCHAAALNSGLDTATATADILSPDLDRFAATNFNCVDCHKPGGASVGATQATCITCHVFHDRSKERAPGEITASSAKLE